MVVTDWRVCSVLRQKRVRNADRNQNGMHVWKQLLDGLGKDTRIVANGRWATGHVHLAAVFGELRAAIHLGLSRRSGLYKAGDLRSQP